MVSGLASPIEQTKNPSDQYTDGDSNKTSVKKHKSVKSEAKPIAFGVGG